MAERKMRYAVLTHFEKYFKIGNKARYQWDADGLLESYSYDSIKSVIDYYARVTKNGSWTTFLYNFDTYRTAMIEREADLAARRKNIEKLRKIMDDERI